jgi:hypothetical protein
VYCLQHVLPAWQYHQGTNNMGVPTFFNAKIMEVFLTSRYAGMPGE